MTRSKKPSGGQPSFGDKRSLGRLRRVQGTKQPQRVLVIVCEGKKTEPDYFGGLAAKYKLSTLDIQIVKDQGAPISIVAEAVEQKKKLSDRRDEVWCVFDTEVKARNASFDKAVDMARSHGLALAVSNPAFEYWYVLHYESTDRPFYDATEALEKLKEYLPHYEKGTPLFKEFEPRIPTAIRNAEQLRQAASEPWDEYPNPSTTVDRLVLLIEDLVRELC